MNRLFAFGDSFTKYAWPMWPELLGQCYEKTYNYGFPGCGNFYIFHKLMIELSSIELTENDTVIVQWSEPLRFDFISDDYWSNLGIGSAELFLRSSVKHLNNETTAIIKHLSYMVAVANFLANKNCKWYFIFLSDDSISHKLKVNITNSLEYDFDKLIGEINKWKDHNLDELSIYSSKIQNNSPMGYSQSGSRVFLDDHPTPLYTYLFIEKYLNKFLNLNLKKIKKYSIRCEKLVNENKVMSKGKLVNNFDTLNKVFNSNE
jgi:hypothetical protein